MTVFVIGYPSQFGGADTELWHVLRLWRRQGQEVSLVPTWRANPEWRKRCDEIGVQTVEVEGPEGFRKVAGLPGSTVVSFCNDQFLANASIFRQLGCRIVWVGCMVWAFPAEKKHYAEHGPFDAYIFQSDFQKSKLLPQIAEFGVTEDRCFRVPGAMDPDEFPFEPRPHPPGEDFVVGRLARPDLDKWSSNTWEIYQAIPYAGRRARLMGWNHQVAKKLGEPPSWAEVLKPCAETAQQFLSSLHCQLAVSGGAQENWPRVGLEAMAAGVPLVVQNQWGWREMIDHGRTGFLADTDEELAYYAARLAMDEDYRQEIIQNAHERLVDELACPDRLWECWQAVFQHLSNGQAEHCKAPSKPRVKVLIGALSGAHEEHRRKRCRETWAGPIADRTDVDLVFLVGDPELSSPRRDGDVLYLPCADDYPSLPQKTRWFCQWALENCDFVHLFKCDDDTYVCVDRLVDYDESFEYSGLVLGGYASGGAGYLLNPTAARIVAERLTHLTGAEDVLVGKVLAEEGISPVADSRFGGWPRWEEVPRSDNRMITSHGWRDRRMYEIHSALSDTSVCPLETNQCRIVEAVAAYGDVGLDGHRGHSVDGSDRLQFPSDGTDWPRYETISAHAPSLVRIELSQATEVVGFMDGACWPTEGDGTRFRIDGEQVAVLDGPNQRTKEFLLQPGIHSLQTQCDGEITRRYPVWALRQRSVDDFHIVITTSNRYVDIIPTTLGLLDKYWPDHPVVDVVALDKPADILVSGTLRQYMTGHQSSVCWTESLISYLTKHASEELLLLLLDDYGLCGKPDTDGVELARRVMLHDPSVGSIRLTSMCIPDEAPYDEHFVVDPTWTYSVHTQASLWRRSSLLRLLRAVTPSEIGHFEIAASEFYNAHLAQEEKHLGFRNERKPPLFLDSDNRKCEWTIPYHNLMHGGQVDGRHAGFLADHDLMFDWPDGSVRARHPEAFNGDGHAIEEVERLVKRFGITTVVETGTHLGMTTAAFADLVNQVHTIELNDGFLSQARTRLASLSNVRMWSGNSAEVLEELLPSLSGPLLFYLDAHGNEYNPLLDELRLIGCRGERPVLIVHDFKVPGRDFGFDVWNGQEYEWQWLKSHVESVYELGECRHYYNTTADGARRGILYVVPTSESPGPRTCSPCEVRK